MFNEIRKAMSSLSLNWPELRSKNQGPKDQDGRRGHSYLLALIALALLGGLALFGTSANAALPSGRQDAKPAAGKLRAAPPVPPAPSIDAFLYFGQAGSNCSIAIDPGTPLTFNTCTPTVLELCLDSGSNSNITGQQSYLTFDSSVLQNVNVSNTSVCEQAN